MADMYLLELFGIDIKKTGVFCALRRSGLHSL